MAVSKLKALIKKSINDSEFLANLNNLGVCDTQNCGIKELDGIQGVDPLEVVLDLMEDHSERPAFLIFSAKRKSKDSKAPLTSDGISLARFIETYRLGQVGTVDPAINPTTSNTIQAWIWRPNWERLNDLHSLALERIEELENEVDEQD